MEILFIILCAAVGFMLLYIIVKAAVKNGIIDAQNSIASAVRTGMQGAAKPGNITPPAGLVPVIPCPGCGKPVTGGLEFCTFCGTKLHGKEE